MAREQRLFSEEFKREAELPIRPLAVRALDEVRLTSSARRR